MLNPSKIAKKFKQEQEELGLTLQDICEKCYLSANTIRRIQNGETNISISTYNLALDVLGLELRVIKTTRNKNKRTKMRRVDD